MGMVQEYEGNRSFLSMRDRRLKLMRHVKTLQLGVEKITRIISKCVSFSKKQLRKDKIVFPFEKACKTIELVCKILVHKLETLPRILNKFCLLIFSTKQERESGVIQ